MAGPAELANLLLNLSRAHGAEDLLARLEGYTNEEIADRLGVSWRRYELGDSCPE
jgi:DNA-directed RNA polymerase specialized sigma24 family protein